MDLSFGVEDPLTDDVRRLLEAHLAFARSVTPPEDVRALDADALDDPAITVFGARSDGELVGVGALRQLDPTHAEVKAMHTVPSARGRGVGRAMVDHLVAVAAGRGCDRLSLETGTMAAFAPSRALYRSAGFTPCPPFGEHTAHSGSVCMTMTIGGDPANG